MREIEELLTITDVIELLDRLEHAGDCCKMTTSIRLCEHIVNLIAEQGPSWSQSKTEGVICAAHRLIGCSIQSLSEDVAHRSRELEDAAEVNELNAMAKMKHPSENAE